MPFRKLMLRLMLWSLAAAAALGALAILLGGQDQLWRVSGTTAVTAVAAALMMLVSLLIDRPAARAAGLLGITAILFEFALAQMLIWELTKLLPILGNEECCALTMVWTFLCGVPAMVLLRGVGVARLRVASIAGLTLAAAAYACLLIGTWMPLGPWSPRGWEAQRHWFGTAGALASIGLAIAANLVSVGSQAERDDPLWLRATRVVGLAAGVLATVVLIVAIWNDLHSDTGVFTTIVGIAVVCSHVNLCMLAPLVGAQRWVRVGAMIAAAVTAGLVDLLVINDTPGVDLDPLVRAAGAAGLVASCGTLALIVLTLMNRRGIAPRREFTEVRAVTLVCPGCERKQQLAIGRSSCPVCRLKFEIRIDEPRCPNCDYLLYRLASDRCPECGTPVPA